MFSVRGTVIMGPDATEMKGEAMKEQRVVYAWSVNNHLELFLREGSGKRTYLMVHRFNPTLWRYLKDGRTVQELRRFHPGRNRGEQAIEHAIRQTVRVIDWLDGEDAA